jgi:hypothetical protein
MNLLSFVIRRISQSPAPTAVTTALAGLLCLANAACAQPTNTLKWNQPPSPATNVFYGWNQEAWYEWFQTADDWVCTNSEPVTRIRWWGSFIGWAQPGLPPQLPARWRIQIWTDVQPNQPPNPRPFSHPGHVIHEIITDAIPFTCVGVDYHPWDTLCQGKTPQPLEVETCYLWELDLKPQEYFYQLGVSNIFWISISAFYTEPMPDVRYPFGLKTRPRDPNSPAPDAAVVTVDPLAPVLGSQWLAGEPLICSNQWWDLAFELCTGTNVVGGSKQGRRI